MFFEHIFSWVIHTIQKSILFANIFGLTLRLEIQDSYELNDM